ncbi:MAG: hypothetical protein ACRDQB_13105, partial [Thermocrispum sp.]
MHIFPALITGLAAAAQASRGWGLLAGLMLAGLFAGAAYRGRAGGVPVHPLLRAVVLTFLGAVAARAFGVAVE